MSHTWKAKCHFIRTAEVTPTSTPTPSTAPASTPDIDTSADVDIEADATERTDIFLGGDLIDGSPDGDVQGPDESVRISEGNSVQIGDIAVAPKDPGGGCSRYAERVIAWV